MRVDLLRSCLMRKASFLFAGMIVAGFCSTASAQVAVPRPDMPTGIDCGNPQNALEYFCNHRNEFNSSGAFVGAGQPVAAAEPGPQVTGATTTHRVVRRTTHH
jgi:hypothetical protein